jgi:hypothetical protein
MRQLAFRGPNSSGKQATCSSCRRRRIAALVRCILASVNTVSDFCPESAQHFALLLGVSQSSLRSLLRVHQRAHRTDGVGDLQCR